MSTTCKAIRVHQIGGPEKLLWEDNSVQDPGLGEVKIRHTAVGLNFIDVYFRKGVYSAPSIPFTPGMEAVGVVIEVGPGVRDVKAGDRVGYAGRPMGAYCEERVINADRLIPIPNTVDNETAAAILLKGMTAQVLLKRCFKVTRGQTILVHAAAGGVGSLLCQWGNALGATIIGTVSNDQKAEQAREDGAHHVIVYSKEDFVARVREITGGKGVSVVYDSVGKDTVQGSLECLAPLGYLVCFGQSSGSANPISLSQLALKSLFLTRPSLLDYTADKTDLVESSRDLFDAVSSGIINVRIKQRYALSEAAKAHEDLEARKTSGSTILVP